MQKDSLKGGNMNKCARYFFAEQGVEATSFVCCGYECCVILRTHMVRPFYCGYVAIPKDHPLAKDIYEEKDSLDVYGGVTFARYVDDLLIVGWDDAHRSYMNRLCKNESRAVRETQKLAKQLRDYA